MRAPIYDILMMYVPFLKSLPAKRLNALILHTGFYETKKKQQNVNEHLLNIIIAKVPYSFIKFVFFLDFSIFSEL